MLLKNSSIKRILVVSLTNIGDVVLTCPVIDILRRDFPLVRMDVVIGPKAVTLFEGNPHLGIKVFHKQADLKDKYEWFLDLFRARYDLVVDLRHTMLGWLLLPRLHTPVIFSKSASVGEHKKQIHLNRLRQIYAFDTPVSQPYSIITWPEDQLFFDKEIVSLLDGQKFVIIAPGAASGEKRWHPAGFASVADYLSASYKVVFVGDASDVAIVQDIQGRMKSSSLSLAGQINLRQLAFILKQCSWAMTHDSGVMHLACYFNVPLIVLWGPTNLNRYAPWSDKAVVIKRNEKCPRCLDPKGNSVHNCMSSIEVNDVIDAVKIFKV